MKSGRFVRFEITAAILVILTLTFLVIGVNPVGAQEAESIATSDVPPLPVNVNATGWVHWDNGKSTGWSEGEFFGSVQHFQSDGYFFWAGCGGEGKEPTRAAAMNSLEQACSSPLSTPGIALTGWLYNEGVTRVEMYIEGKEVGQVAYSSLLLNKGGNFFWNGCGKRGQSTIWEAAMDEVEQACSSLMPTAIVIATPMPQRAVLTSVDEKGQFNFVLTETGDAVTYSLLGATLFVDSDDCYSRETRRFLDGLPSTFSVIVVDPMDDGLALVYYNDTDTLNEFVIRHGYALPSANLFAKGRVREWLSENYESLREASREAEAARAGYWMQCVNPVEGAQVEPCRLFYDGPDLSTEMAYFKETGKRISDSNIAGVWYDPVTDNVLVRWRSYNENWDTIYLAESYDLNTCSIEQGWVEEE